MKEMLLSALCVALILLSGCASVEKLRAPSTLSHSAQPQIQNTEGRGVVVLNKRLNADWRFKLKALF